MNISEAYKKYNIMPQLAQHQLRVAGVADIILDHSSFIVDRREIVAACLLHDMGNIIKFDFGQSKSLLNLDIDVGHWQKIKDEYTAKYGNDEHEAALKICRELAVSERVLELVDAVGFTTATANEASQDFGRKICAYSDMRVGPMGVISLAERLKDLRTRYAHRTQEWGGRDTRDGFEKALANIEAQIFARCRILPREITPENVQIKIQTLKTFEICPVI